jgi:DNA recombination protein RmuC
VAAYTALDEQLRALVDVHLPRLHSETASLVKALRQPTARGRWGELQLRRAVEMAGMQPHCDFAEQTTVDTEAGRLRPDVIVALPGGRSLVIDAKAPVDAYLNTIEATGEEARRRFLAQHAAQVRGHMAQLGRKMYFEQFQHTPDFVIMFIPEEAFFSAALEADPGLIGHGVAQRVIPASPTTLIALKAVAYGWQQEEVARHAREVTALGNELYKRIADMARHWADMGKRLGQAVEFYNRSVGTLEGRVLVSARRFADLHAAPPTTAIAELEPIQIAPRPLTAPELRVDPERRALEAPAAPREDE